MKKLILTALVSFAIIAAQATPIVINFWHFNNLTTAYHNPGIPAVKANYSVIDTNKAVIAYKLLPGTQSAYGGYIDNVLGTDTNTRLSITAAGAANNAYRMRNPSDSAYMQIYIPTTGYKNIALSYVLESSSTTSGQLTQNFDYSVDSGATWRTTGLNITTLDVSQAKFQGANWGLVNINFAGDTASTNNNAKLVFRIKFAGNTTGTSGNNRFDNLVVEGDAIASTGVANTASEAGLNLYPNPAHNYLVITLNDGTKSIQVINNAGQLVNTIVTTETIVKLDVASYVPGQYHIVVKNNGIMQKNFSFIKN